MHLDPPSTEAFVMIANVTSVTPGGVQLYTQGRARTLQWHVLSCLRPYNFTTFAIVHGAWVNV